MEHPPAANQKRKRGRRANTSRDDGVKDASSSTAPILSGNSQPKVTPGTEDGAVDEGLRRPRKRSRRSNDDVPQEPQPESSATQNSRRSRRQPSTAQMEGKSAPKASESLPSAEMKATRRGRPRKAGQPAKPAEPEAEEADDENENEGDSSLLRRSKRHRRSSGESHGSPENQGVQGEEVRSSITQQAAKRRKRSIRSKDDEQPEEEADPEGEAESTSRAQKRKQKRIRPSQNIEAESGLLPQKKRGRPIRSEGGGRNSETGPQSRSSQRQTEPVVDEPQAESSRQRRPGTTRRKSNSRRQSSEGQDQLSNRSSSPASAPSPLPYRHIAKRTRRVTHNTIESKWSSLEPSSLINIASLLHSVSLPPLLHVPQKQYAHAEDVLEKVIKGLRKRSARLPFPLASALPRREDELDFERTQSAVEILISQLDPLQHSVELLRREKERAEKDLEREYKVLDQLSTNARAEARERRDRLRKVHILVPEPAYDSTINKGDLLHADKATSQIFTGIRDEELLSLAGQINNHMESMRGNLQQIDGVLPAIAKSHALLRTTLQPQFSHKQLENIMLGHVEP
ncbi:CENP-Q, a CENPA-CAD centromere complex subunit-domain-containing protein [Xylaria sp. FL1777]|nr:CENP-Q, a CENPA-CAD centromere complex subunit-domain-containing protein [Xylaria sp. FL1777]